MSNKLISIIIPIYNVEKYLGECLDSILAQTYQNFEVILVENNSTDSSLDICNEYAKKDSRFKIVYCKEQGCGIARNKGLEVIQGDYVTFVDGDDLIPRKFFEILLRYSNNKDIPYVDSLPYGSYRKKRKKPIDIIKHKNILTKFFKEKKLYLITAWGKLYPKEFVTDLYFVSGYMEDVPVVYKVLLKANNLIRCNEIFYIYRKREESLTTDPNMKKYLSILYKNTPMIEEDLKKRKAKFSAKRAFYYRKLNGDLMFIIQTYNNSDEEIIQAVNFIRNDIKKHLFKYILLSKLKISFQLILFALSPHLFFYVRNTFLKIKRFFSRH